jgi:hypothetical protein
MAWVLVMWIFTSSIFTVSDIATEEDCRELAKKISNAYGRKWAPDTYRCIPYKKAP